MDGRNPAPVGMVEIRIGETTLPLDCESQDWNTINIKNCHVDVLIGESRRKLELRKEVFILQGILPQSQVSLQT